MFTFARWTQTTCASPAIRINDFLTPNPFGAPQLDFSKLTRLPAPSETIHMAKRGETTLVLTIFILPISSRVASPPSHLNRRSQ
jgi:hypothetical protein